MNVICGHQLESPFGKFDRRIGYSERGPFFVVSWGMGRRGFFLRRGVSVRTPISFVWMGGWEGKREGSDVVVFDGR